MKIVHEVQETKKVLDNKLYLSHVNSPFGGRLLKFKGSQLLNRLPKYLINIKSHQLFNKKITVLLSI